MAEQARQEREGQLQRHFHALQGRAFAVYLRGNDIFLIGIVVEVGGRAGPQHVATQAELGQGGDVSTGDREALDLLDEAGDRQQRLRREVPFHRSVEVGGTERIEERISEGHAVVETVDRATGIEVAERGAGDDFGDGAAHDNVMARIERDVDRRQPVVVAAPHGGGDAGGVARRCLLRVGIANAGIACELQAEDVALDVELEVAARGLFPHAAIVAEILDGGAGIEIGIIGCLVDVGHHPRTGRAAGLAGVSQIDQARNIGRDRQAVDAGRASDLAQDQIRPAVRGAGGGVALEQLGAEIVAAPDRTGLHREAVRQIPFRPQLRGLELVLHVGRAVADFRELEVRRIGDVKTVVQHRRLHVRIVEVEAIGIAIVVGESRFDRDVGVRLREAAQRGEAEGVAKVLVPGRAELVELSFRFAQVAFGADPGVDRIHEVEAAFVRPGENFQPLLGTVFLERGVQTVDRELGAVGRLELDRARQAEAAAVMLDHAVARDAGVERERGGVAGCRGAIAAARGDRRTAGRADVRIEAWGAVHRIEVGLGPADGVVAALDRIGVGVGSRQIDAEGAGIVAPGQQAGNARPDIVRKVVVRSLHVEHGG